MWSSYFYIALPLVVLKLIFHDVKYLVYLHKVFLLSNVKENLKYGAATIIMLEIFVSKLIESEKVKLTVMFTALGCFLSAIYFCI